MSDEEIVTRYGKNDGYDADRLRTAKDFSAILDKPVFMMFESLVRLEDNGLIKLSEPT